MSNVDKEIYWPGIFGTLLIGGFLGIILGVFFWIKDFLGFQKYGKYDHIFEAVSLKSTTGNYPSYLGEDNNEYLQLLSFHATIPIEVWQHKKPLLEAYLNKKILKIENATDNNNVVNVYIEKKPLTDFVEWTNESILIDDYFSLGVDQFDTVFIDLNKSPHVFVAGETGSGKSVLIKTLIYQALMKHYDVKVIDFKRGVSFVEFSRFIEIFSDYQRIDQLLSNLVQETNRRLDLFRETRVENINQYNQQTNREMKRVVVFIDELAELMRSTDKDANKSITASLETLTRLSRAVGIHLVMGLQRPDSSIVNGQIKNNVALRICGRFVDPEPSRIMLHNDLANDLPNIKGRFILKDGNCREFQAFYIDRDIMNLGEDVDTAVYKDQNMIDSESEPVVNTQEQPKEAKIDFNFDDII